MGFKLAMYSTAAVLAVSKALSDVYRCIYENGHTKILREQGRMITFPEFRDITDEEFWKEEFFLEPEDLALMGQEAAEVRARRSRMFTGANDNVASYVPTESEMTPSHDAMQPHPPTSSPQPSASRTRPRKLSCSSAFVPTDVVEAMERLDV